MACYNSVDASKMGRPDRFDDDYQEPEQWEGSPDALEYSELRAYGYQYLVEPIMNAGGYVAVSNALGIPISPMARRNRRGYEKGEQPLLLQPPQERQGFLALGGSLDERIEAAAAAAPKAAALRTSLFDKQAAMDPEERAARRRARDAPPAPLYPRSPAQQAAAAARAAEQDAAAAAPPAERLALSAVQRAYLLATAAATAVGYGRASAEAVAAHGLPQDAVQAAAAVSLVLLLANAGSAVLSLRLAISRGRSAPLWGLKAALTGPVCLSELRLLGPLQPSSDP
jgi:hypothetical protein